MFWKMDFVDVVEINKTLKQTLLKFADIIEFLRSMLARPYSLLDR